MEYVNCLVRSTANVAESYVITQKDLGTGAIMVRARFLRKLKELQPDIIHVHAAWDSTAALIEHTARSHGFYTVVSVHGGLAPEVMELAFFKHKLPGCTAGQAVGLEETYRYHSPPFAPAHKR